MKTEVYVIKFICETEQDREKIHDAVKEIAEEFQNPFGTEVTQAILESSDYLEEQLT
tara:strand:- start:1031 stop:1201 length:171 start_codon:yes stop_codon:yes gene_type:complete